MNIEKIYVGGWFQRTSLHLSEIYDFLRDADSPLDLDKEKLKSLQNDLIIEDLGLEVDYFERIKFSSRSGIAVGIYEDGLIVLSKKSGGDVG